MSDFKSWWDFIRFQNSVRSQARYVWTPRSRDFLEALVASSASRRMTIDANDIYWRAQRGSDIQEREVEDVVVEDSIPHPAARMKPLQHSACEGRVNPKGIPCLYLATDKETAMAEVRPWVGDLISVGQFKITRQLTLIDFSKEDDTAVRFYEKEPNANDRERVIWAQISRFFSRPVTNDPHTAEYVSTQIVAETFRQQHFDGVRYKRFLGGGLNVALFDLDAATFENGSLHEVQAVSFEFEERTAKSSKH